MTGTVRAYWDSWLVRIGLLLLVGGSSPLLLIVAAAKLGLTADPDPNPIGPGILLMLTFWPGVICLLIGIGAAAATRRRDRGRRQTPGA